MVMAAPLLGGVLLVASVVGEDPASTRSGLRVLAATGGALLSHRVILAFLLALAVVIVGGSLFVFLIKGGTVAMLVQGDRGRAPGAPAAPGSVATQAAGFSIERFIDSSETLFPRYARLGFFLMAVYLGPPARTSAVVASRSSEGRGAARARDVLFVVWTTVVNLLYLLVQIVIAAEECGVGAATKRVLAFVRAPIARSSASSGLSSGWWRWPPARR